MGQGLWHVGTPAVSGCWGGGGGKGLALLLDGVKCTFSFGKKGPTRPGIERLIGQGRVPGLDGPQLQARGRGRGHGPAGLGDPGSASAGLPPHSLTSSW